MARKKRIAVIGGGFSGLSAIRALKEEGMEPICFEKTSKPGGTWCYREQATYGVPSIMPTTIINHSKEMGALSNFPPKKEYPNYMRHSQLYQYFTDVGEGSDCFRHMVYDSEVLSVRRADTYDMTGQWEVVVKNTRTGSVTSDIFDGAMVCVGHITYPRMATFPGMEQFKGTIVHTHSLKHVYQASGKRICVIGIGCSGLDAAVETSNVAEQVYLSSRSGSWILPRVGPHGLPMDYVLLRRYLTTMQEILPISLASKYLEKIFLSPKVNHDLYNLKPQYPLLCKDPSINDILPVKLLSGSVILKKNVKYFTEKGVMFEGDDKITEVDMVIMATGYEWKYPFLEEDILTTEKDGRINLYKCMWSPNLKHQTLAIIGFVLPFGPGFPLGEIQCRWVAQVLGGKSKLPSKDDMMKEITKRHNHNMRRYRPGDKMSIRVDFVPYMDDIASQFGAKPNFLKMLFTDPKLFKACVFGPSLPYQYRLQGPHKWRGARKAILTANERMKAPLCGDGPNRKNSQFGHLLKFILNFLLMSMIISFKESSISSYLIAALIPLFMSLRSFFLKFLFILLALPLLIPWNGFVGSYLVIVLGPPVVSWISSLTNNYITELK